MFAVSRQTPAALARRPLVALLIGTQIVADYFPVTTRHTRHRDKPLAVIVWLLLVAANFGALAGWTVMAKGVAHALKYA